MAIDTRTRTSHGTGPAPGGRSGHGFRNFLIFVVVLAVAGVAYATATGKIPGLRPQPSPTTSTNSPVLIGDDPEYQFYAGSDGESKTRTCNPVAVVDEHRCCPIPSKPDIWQCDVKVVVIDANRMLYISRNIYYAWIEGKPSILHRESAGRRTKHDRVCSARKFTKVYPEGSCDEYPFASSLEGGNPSISRTEEVHDSEQNCQGGTVSGAYQAQNITEPGGEYIVLIAHPEKVPTATPWAGQPYEAISC